MTFMKRVSFWGAMLLGILTAASGLQAAESGALSVTLSSASTEFQGQLGPDGSVVAGSIPVKVTITNHSNKTWSCEACSIVLVTRGAISREERKRSYISPGSQQLKPGESRETELDAGNFLTGAASLTVKGDDLETRAISEWISGREKKTFSSEPLKLHVAIPEA